MRQVTAHLRELKRGFDSGALSEDTIKNYFVIEFEIIRIIGFVERYRSSMHTTFVLARG